MFLVKMYEQESRNKREQGPIYIVVYEDFDPYF